MEALKTCELERVHAGAGNWTRLCLDEGVTKLRFRL